ncbi:protein phosphatase 2C family protein, partial [archaeon]
SKGFLIFLILFIVIGAALFAIFSRKPGKEESKVPRSSHAHSLRRPSLVGVEIGAEDDLGYFAVFDGHCGDQASTFLQEVLLDRICRHPLFHQDTERAIIETCVALDKEFLVRYIFMLSRMHFFINTTYILCSNSNTGNLQAP